ncbi:Uncharacterized protein PCOAH_00049060 [Plasmodium coatneyi]|uniref:Uncharacterized protein n=1 Tax=Plasmodium coatneyi TaxID=208452 RepID=A0A1B1E6W3_9APIC|nr:Uncharacterized protein PCOAH_00049060 [Plasmodium coatneyi]ANQ10738.1 Uncharacterized protein PCOAH_00049060 [Plasmodium coatneyi]
MEESLFIDLDGNKNLLDFIKKYEERLKRENSTNMVFSGEDMNEQNGSTQPIEQNKPNEGKPKGGRKNSFISESDKLHLLQCLSRASFSKEGTLDGPKKKENIFRYHSFCINGGEKAAIQKGNHASSQKLGSARGVNRTAKQWLRSQQRIAKLVPKRASPEGPKEELREAPKEEDPLAAQKSGEDTPKQHPACSQVRKKEQNTKTTPNSNEKIKRHRKDILLSLQNNNSSRSVQISKGKKKQKEFLKNNSAIDIVPSSLHGKKSSPNLFPMGGNASRTKAVHSTEWVKKTTTNRWKEGLLPRGAGFKLQRGRVNVARPNLAGSHRGGPDRSKNEKWGTPREGGKKEHLPPDEQNRHTSTSRVDIDHSLENSLILTVSSSSSASSSSSSPFSSSSSCNVIYSVSSYDKEGTRKSSRVVFSGGDDHRGGHTHGMTRHYTVGREEAVKVGKNISPFVPPCEMDTQEEEVLRGESAEGCPVNVGISVGGQTVRRKNGKKNSTGKREKRAKKSIPIHGKAEQVVPLDQIDPVEEMCQIVRYKKAVTKLKRKILNGVKRIREVHSVREAAHAGGHPGGQFVQFVKRAKRALEDRRAGSTSGMVTTPDGQDRPKGRSQPEPYQRADTCELFLQKNKNEALLRKYIDRKKHLMNHVKTYILIHQRRHQKECLHKRRAEKGGGNNTVAMWLEVDSERKKKERKDQPCGEVNEEGEFSPMISPPQGEDLQMVVTPLLSEAVGRSSHGCHVEKTDSLTKQPFVVTHDADYSVITTQGEVHKNAKNEEEGKLKKSEINLKDDKGSVKERIFDNRTFEEELLHPGSFSSKRVKEFLNGSDILTKELETPNGWSALGRSSFCLSHLDTLSKSKEKINAMKSGKMFLCSSENKAPREEYIREVRLKKGGEMRLSPTVRTDLLDNCAAIFAFLRSQLGKVNSALTGGRLTKGSHSPGGDKRNYLRSLRRNVKRHLEELRRTKIVAFILSVLPEKSNSPCTPTCSVKQVRTPNISVMRVGTPHISLNHGKSPNWIAPLPVAHPVRCRVPTNVFRRRRKGKIATT